MTVQDDRMWADVLDAHTPNAAEMAAAEAELQALGEVPPLPAADVETLVVRATGGGAVIGGIARARRFREPMLRAAAAALLLIAVAAVALKATQAKPRLSEPTSYVDAINLVTEPHRSDADYLLALIQIVDHCVYAADTLRQLASQVGEPDLARQAREISAELAALLTNGPSVPPPVADLRMVESATTALRKDVPLKLRQEALTHVGELARSGLTAMLLSQLASGEANDKRRASIKRILGMLPR